MKIADMKMGEKRAVLPLLSSKSFLAFLCYTDARYEPSDVHRYLANKLEKVESGEIKRLIITMPPRHGKSRIAGIEFPAWFLGKDPTRSVIMSSYGDALSLKHSREARDRCKSVAFSKIFPKAIPNPKLQSKNTWGFMQGGSYSSTTVGGGMTGLGADLLIIDDPHKNRQEAESKLVRDRIWEWFTSTAFTRLSRHGAVVLIMTRWHVDDLVGKLLSDEYNNHLKEMGQEDEKWDLVELPAICEKNVDELGRKKGEALWSERWDTKAIQGIEANIGAYDYTSLYRCTPRIKGGNVANVDGIKYIDINDIPKSVELVRTWDLAITDKDKSDFTAGCLAGYDRTTGNFYIAHMAKLKANWFGVKKKVIEYAEREGTRIGVEAVSGFKTAYEEIKMALHGKTQVKYSVPRENKMIRANSWMSRIDSGKVYVAKGIWNADFIDELSVFPDGKHDDQVDAVSLAWEMTYKNKQLLIA
jgi:predicted phage terminase large subunit-like protein